MTIRSPKKYDTTAPLTAAAPSGDLGPIKETFYGAVAAESASIEKNQLKLLNVKPVDTAGLGNFPWFWNNIGTFNTATWNWFNTVFAMGDSGYLEAHPGLVTELFNTYNQIAYVLSDADQAKVNTANNKAQVVIGTVVGDYTTMFGPIPPASSATASAKISYVTDQIMSWGAAGLTLDTFRNALDPASLLPNAPAGSSKIINDFLDYLNQTSAISTIQNAVATQNAEIRACKRNLQPAPSSVQPGWMSTAATDGSTEITPYLTMAESTANIQNALFPTSGGLNFSVKLSVSKLDQNTVKVTASAGAGGSGWIDWFRFSAGASASYNMFSFDQHLTNCEVEISFNGVTKITPQLSASAYQASTGVGWWNPKVIQQAVGHKDGTSGLQFTTPPTYDYGTDGTFGVLSGIVISQVPTFKMTYQSSDFSSFQQTFQEQSNWSVSFLGIPLGGGSQSYYSSSLSQDSSAQTITVTMAPPAQSTPVSPLDQLAYVVGAVADWPGAQ